MPWREWKVGLIQYASRPRMQRALSLMEAAAHDPERLYRQRLLEYLTRNADTRFGREHDFHRLRSIEDYQSAIPVRDYDGLRPWIDAAMEGEQAVLTTEAIRLFEKTGGSTSANKFIPYTQTLRQEFESAMLPWVADTYRRFPGLKGTRNYWSISPAAQHQETSAGGLPIGGTDDSEYFSPLIRWAWQQTLAVPLSVARISDMETWKWESCRALLLAEDLGMISVWSPTFASNLFSYIQEKSHELLASLPKNRAVALGDLRTFNASRIWPRLQLLSCWTDGISEQFLPILRMQLGKVPVQGKGLLATEGAITIPWSRANGNVLAALGHFVEFQDLADGSMHLPYHVKVGGRYSPVLTTSGGLYRYLLKDEVLCTGFYGRLPKLVFIGKRDKVSDLVGEKISAAQVEELFREGRTRFPYRFAMLAPLREGPAYALFLESELNREGEEAFRDFVEAGLRRGHHYNYARDLGQLQTLGLFSVKDGARTYEDALVAAGQRRGDIKASSLDAREDWLEIFGIKKA